MISYIYYMPDWIVLLSYSIVTCRCVSCEIDTGYNKQLCLLRYPISEGSVKK